MRDAEGERLFYLGFGPLLAIGLGLALVPLRGFTSASNFTFVFLALTIVVAEYGGQAAAVATAVTAALSLDFFLTEPYMQLTIADKHDVIAFVGLAVCGLIAAALGSQRGEHLAGRQHGELLRAGLREWTEASPSESGLEGFLQMCAKALPVEALALRDLNDRVLAASVASAGLRAVPERALQPDSLLATKGPGSASPERPLPEQGGRLALVFAGQRLGWLDLWGNGAPADIESRRALSDVGRLLATFLAGTNPASR